MRDLAGHDDTELEQWEERAQPPELMRGDAHVWFVSLNDPAAKLDTAHLSDEEGDRAARFRFAADRDRFITAHIAVRGILAGYTGLSPAEISFHLGPQGKPALSEPQNAKCLKFNLSHSEGLALVAVTVAVPVGIDIEHIKPEFPGLDIAQRFFSAGEMRQLQALPDDLLAEAFFSCWTRKEALIKAKGGGLSLPLNQFEVTVDPGVSPELLWADPCLGIEKAALRSGISPSRDYAAALAVLGSLERLRCFRWSPLSTSA